MILLLNVQHSKSTAIAVLPNKELIFTTQKGQMPISNLSDTATNTKTFSTLNKSIISLGRLCDDNHIFILAKHSLIVTTDIKPFSKVQGVH